MYICPILLIHRQDRDMKARLSAFRKGFPFDKYKQRNVNNYQLRPTVKEFNRNCLFVEKKRSNLPERAAGRRTEYAKPVRTNL